MLLTVREAAALLRATEREVYRWVDAGEIPCQRVRDQVRFNRTDLLEWATARRRPVALEAFDVGADGDERAPSLAKALRIGGVHVDIEAADRESALRAILERTPIPKGVDREFLLEVLLALEHTSSTAIGDGIAIPHVRHPVVAAGAPMTVSVTHLREPLSLDAPDGEPVETVFLIVSPTVRTHLQMLAHIARALMDPGFRGALKRRAGTEELAAEAARIEAACAPSNGREGGSSA